MNMYSGARYIWTLNQAAIAAARFPYFEPTWIGLEALQERWAQSGSVMTRDDQRNFPWARQAFASAEMRFNPKYEEVVA